MDMQQQAIRQVLEAADRAISAEDFDALMAFYAEDATLVVRPGTVAHGKAQIRKAFEAIAEHFGHHLDVRQGKIEIVQGGDTALVIMESLLDTRVTNGSAHTITRRATYVFRHENGKWLCVVDNSYGTGLLDAAQVAGAMEETATV
jgi:uncharacterized protein (TIGR02246 family)